jgi:predicted transposase YbfD/YdcC
MNNPTLDQKAGVDSIAEVNTATKVQRKSHTAIADMSIMERLKDFTFSISDFRRTDKGNHRHKLRDIIMLIILARMSKCISRADMIEFGKHNIRRFQSMGLLRNGVPSEPTLCRVENGIDSMELANRMAEFSKIFHDELADDCGHPEIINIDGKAMCGTVQENGRNPDIVSAYSPSTGITLATEACKEKSNEIKAVPLLLDKIDIAGKLVTADAMSMQKEIIDKIREKGGYFLIELKANQRALRYGVEDRIKQCIHKFSHTEDFKLEHGRIETRTYKVYDGLELIVDKDKWGGNLTVVEFISNCTKKSTGAETSETRFYVSNLPDDTPWIGMAVRKHWAIESMHWGLDFNLLQDSIKRKTTKAARNLDTLQRIVYSLFSIWKGRRKKRSDKAKGLAKLMRHVSRSFTNLLHFLSQK